MKDSPTACEEFYGLRARAFSLTPDLRFVYHSQSHTHAVEEVTAALRRREGLIVVTGEVGTGKTMLCRTLLETFETRTFQSVILDPLLTVEDLLYQVLIDFGLIGRGKKREPFSDVTRHSLVTTLQKFLASLIPLDAHAVIMIDEAQHLGPQVLEEIRLLSNFETDQAKLLQIVLVGQPNLDALLRRPDMRQLNQRVARRCELQPLTSTEVRNYIERRLIVATEASSDNEKGTPAQEDEPRAPVELTPEALEAVATISEGIPRIVNTLCDRALEAGFERRVNSVDLDAVLTGAAHLKLPVPAVQRAATSRQVLYATAIVLVLLAGLAAWWWTRPTATDSAPAPASSQAVPLASPHPRPAAPPADVAPTAPSRPADSPPASAPPLATSAPKTTRAPARIAAPSGRTYQIVVAAFRTEQRANGVVDTLKGAGFPVAARFDSTSGWYSIVVGPYPTQDEAGAAQATIEAQGFSDTRLTSNNPASR